MELKQTSKEMKEEGQQLFILDVSISKSDEQKEEKEELVLDQEELREIYKEIKMRAEGKKRKRETERYEMQVEHLRMKMAKDGSEGIDEEMKAKMVEVLREDEWEVQVKKLKSKGDMKEEKQKRQQVL